MSVKLRELIRTVRACKTAAEERAVIAKECALIRTAFKDEDQIFRHRNIAKLIYISMLGYPTHFGQLETLKLIASQKFSDKRIGYLGMALLIEEHAEFLTLVTNSLSQDMLCTTNPYVCGLALGAMANVGSREMLRDLTQNLSKIIDQSSEVYVKKKALICLALLFQHEPDLAPDFLPRISALLAEPNHAIQLCAMTCLYETCNRVPVEERGKMRKACLLTVIRILKRLVTGDGFQPEYDVSGHSDPHLQVVCLKFLRVLGHKHDKASEEMSDILAQVATNTDGSKNAGNAILNEVVRTIMGIESEPSLKVLAVNIMGKFLGNKDANMKYVALATLERLVQVDFNAVARQRTTIVQCLKDPDVSIRNRALENTFLLLEDSSVSELMREIVQYLGVAPLDQKSGLSSRIADVLDRFPQQSTKWRVDTLLDVLTVAGNEAPRNVWRQAVSMIGQQSASDMRAHIVHRLFASLDQAEEIQLGLAQAGLWVLGEFAHELLAPPPASCAEAGFVCQARTPGEILDVVQRMLRAHDSDSEMKAMALTALAKLVARLPAMPASDRQRLDRLLATYRTSMNVELQLRSVEYAGLLAANPGVLSKVLEPMPVPDEQKLKEVRTRSKQQQHQHARHSEENDLMHSLSISAPVPQQQQVAASTAAAPAPAKNLIDLDDLFGGGGASVPPQPPAPAAMGSNDLLDLFGGGQPAAATAAPPKLSVVAFDEGGLQIVLALTSPAVAPGQVAGTFTFTGAGFSDVALLAAVPKYMTVKLLPASGSTLSGSSRTITQQVEFVNPVDKPYTMKLKVTYTDAQGQAVVAQAVVSNFPK